MLKYLPIIICKNIQDKCSYIYVFMYLYNSMKQFFTEFTSFLKFTTTIVQKLKI